MKLRRGLTFSLAGEFLSKFPLYGFEFVLASTLALHDYAKWTALLIFIRFAPYCHFGALSYFNKRYPFYNGKQLLKAKNRVSNQTNFAINSILLIMLGLALLSFFFSLISIDELLIILAVLLTQIYAFCQSKVRNNGDFASFSIGLLLFACVQFLASLVLVKNLNVLGGILSVFIGYIVAVSYYLFTTQCKYRFVLMPIKKLYKILKLGTTPFLLTISAFFIQIADRIALVFADNEKNLAFYGFFSIFMQLGIVIVNSTGKVLGPYILTKSSEKNVISTIKISVYNCYFIFGFYLCFSLFIYAFGNLFIDRYFSNFSGSILGLYNYAIVGFVLAIGLVFYPQLISVNREKYIIGLNVVFGLILLFSIYLTSKNIEGVGGFSLTSLTINSMLTLLFIHYVEKSLGFKLFNVRLIVFFILLNTYIVNIYVWN